MSLLWVKLANHGDKSIVSSGSGYLLLYFIKKVAPYVTFNFSICLDSQKHSHRIRLVTDNLDSILS